MELSLVVLMQCAIMLIYMIIGYVLYKTKLINDAGSKAIGNILVYVVIPIVVVKAFLIPRTDETTINMLWSFALGALSLLIAILVGFIVYKTKNGALNFATAFSNCGFMGIPLISAVLGDNAVIYITGMNALMAVLQFTYGQYILTKNKSIIKIKNILLSPALIALILGIILYFCNFNLPEIITTPIDGIQALNTPLATIVMGIYLAQTPLKNIFIKPKIYLFSLIRLFIVPLITMFLFLLFPVDKTVLLTIIIASSAPAGCNVVIFSQKNNLNAEDGILAVCQSTLFSIVSLPLITMLANLLLEII